MKKPQKKWSYDIAFLAAWIVLCLSLIAVYFVNTTLFYIQLCATMIVGALSIWRITRRRYLFSRYLERLSKHLKQVDETELENSPFPVLAITDAGEILWYNRLFRQDVLGGADKIGDAAGALLGDTPVEALRHHTVLDVHYNGRRYSVLYKVVAVRTTTLYVLYYWDNTEL